MAVKNTTGNDGRKAIKNASPHRKDTGDISGKRIVLLWTLLFAFILLAAGVIWLIYWLPGALIYDNPRFIVRRVEVESSGYWAGRGDELIARINEDGKEELLRKNKTNLFSVDAESVQKKLEDIHSIQHAEVHLVLPDMIVFKLSERIPRAVLADTGYVLDEYAEKFPIRESVAMEPHRRLPKIRGYRKLQSAVDLIMTANRDCEDIVIYSIDTQKYQDRLEVILTYRNGRPWVVWFPADERSFSLLFNQLKNLIIQTSISGSRYKGFDLRPRDYAVPLK